MMISMIEDDDEAQALVIDEEFDSGQQSHGLKQPITLLQEICSRNGLTAEYQLLSTEGSVHEPTFKIAVTVNDITVTASGQSKKKARHAAAREAIEKLKHRNDLNFDGINFGSLTTTAIPETKSAYEIGCETNPVGKLQEYCMKMRLKPPNYDTCNENGLAHERLFLLSCSISSLSLRTFGQGRSKKLAKRHAAEQMLIQLENSELYDKPTTAKMDDKLLSSLHMDSDDYSNFLMSRRLQIEVANRLDMRDLRRELEEIEEDIGNQIFYNLFKQTVLDNCDLKPSINYVSDGCCLLKVEDCNGHVASTAFGRGDSNLDALRKCVCTLYKNMITIKEGAYSHCQNHQVVVGT